MKGLKTAAGLALAAMLLTGCKKEVPTVTFQVEGKTVGLPDGEQLYLVNSEGESLDTLVVKDGKFTYTGPADSVRFMTLIQASNQMNSMNFFTEPGIISVTIDQAPGKGSVSGTVANNALQELMEATYPYYDKINEIETIIYSDTTLTSEAEWALSERYMQLYGEIEKRHIEAAQKNTDNELGYMLVVNYIDEQLNSDLLRELIAKMPDSYRQRQPVVRLLQSISNIEATAEGHVMPDFTLATPEGEQLNVMSLVKGSKMTVIDFWASWCEPCRKEMPMLRQLMQDYQPKGLSVVGISLDNDSAAWRKAIVDLKMGWPQLSDLKGKGSTPAKAFRVNNIPYTVVVDSLGTILKKGLRGEELKEYVAASLP